MAQYFITTSVPPDANWAILVGVLQSNGLPVTDVQTSGAYPGQIIVVTDTDLTQSQQTLLNSLVAAFDPRPRGPRQLYAIYNDLAALTAAQQTAIWGNMSAGTPPKYLLDIGTNAAAVAVFDWVINKSGSGQAALTDARLRIAAFYVQDNPKYLVNPSFASTVNVPGDQPIG